MTMCVRCNATEGQRRPNGWHLCGDCDEEHKREEYFEKALEALDAGDVEAAKKALRDGIAKYDQYEA